MYNLSPSFRLELTSSIFATTSDKGLTEGLFAPNSSNKPSINEDLIEFELRIFETGSGGGKFGIEDQERLASAVLQVPKGELPSKFTIQENKGLSEITVECSN